MFELDLSLNGVCQLLNALDCRGKGEALWWHALRKKVVPWGEGSSENLISFSEMLILIITKRYYKSLLFLID